MDLRNAGIKRRHSKMRSYARRQATRLSRAAELRFHGRRRSACETWTHRASSSFPKTMSMRRKTLSEGPIRRGDLVATNGVGAMTITRNGTSVLIAGLDHWFKEGESYCQGSEENE